MERLPGEDLGKVYSRLTKQQKQAIAEEVAAIQQKVTSLPQASGFGYAKRYDDPELKSSWEEVISAYHERSRTKIKAAGILNTDIVDLVQKKFDDYTQYFKKIQPKAFLDDTTTKNVIIHEGTLQGIVDIDFVCFGDRLQTLGLTQMSLLELEEETDYIEYWAQAIGVSQEQRKIIDLYSTMYAVDFLSSMGHSFNKEAAMVDKKKISKLIRIMEGLLKKI